jgi:hypothetical protein
MEKASDGVFLVTTEKTDDDEGDHDHEDESEWDITLNGPGLALQAAAA